MTRSDFNNLITNNFQNAKCIWWFNVGLDFQWDQKTLGFFPRIESADKMSVLGMEQMMLMLASKNDVVIMHRQPNEMICNNIREIFDGLPAILTPANANNNQKSISEIILDDNKLIKILKDISKESKTYLVPYAITKYENRIAELIGTEIVGPSYDLASWINSKITARNIARELDFDVTFGVECHSFEDLSDASNSIKSKHPECTMVLKDDYGASGKGLFFIKRKSDWDLVLHRANKLQKNDVA
ncbi:MAG: hypothetical protein GX941_09940, partial [Candidatus Methanofastidiosa archaeon]|nr:hypothetical protein [Candidatus Methanofastidiosa archaeon]